MIEVQDMEQAIRSFKAGLAQRALALGTDVRDELETQTGYVMRDLASELPPSTRGKTERAIERDVGKVFATAPRRLLFGNRRRGTDMTWTSVGPRFLIGVEPRMFYPSEDMEVIYSHARPGLGRKFTRLGNRGKQNVQRLNRYVVNKGKLAAFIRSQKLRVGKLKASVALGWESVRAKGRKPAAWIMRHVNARTARGSYINNIRTADKATFTIISNAAGAEKPAVLAIVRRVLAARIQAMKYDLTLRIQRANKRRALR